MTLLAGTAVRFVTEAAIDSKSVRQGQRFTIIVADDVVEGGLVFLPKGTRAVGEIEAVSTETTMGRGGSLALRPLFVDLGTRRIYFEGVATQKGGDKTGVAAVSFYLIGGLVPVRGKSAILPAGSSLDGKFRTDVTLAWPIR